jgi:hypothetical protein
MSSAAAAADAPEEFAALAEYAVDDFMSEAASDVEVFATTEGHGDVSAEEIRFLARDPQAHDRVMSRVARLPRRALRRLLRAAGFDEPVWQTRIRRATAASLAEEAVVPSPPNRRRRNQSPRGRHAARILMTKLTESNLELTSSGVKYFFFGAAPFRDSRAAPTLLLSSIWGTCTGAASRRHKLDAPSCP